MYLDVFLNLYLKHNFKIYSVMNYITTENQHKFDKKKDLLHVNYLIVFIYLKFHSPCHKETTKTKKILYLSRVNFTTVRVVKKLILTSENMHN